MIKPRSQPSHFKPQAEAQPWKDEGKFNVHSLDSFNPMSVESQLPVTPMGSVTPSAVEGRGSKVGIFAVHVHPVHACLAAETWLQQP